MFPAKFCHLVGDEHVPYDYGNIYFEQPCGDGFRLVIGPSANHIEVLTELAAVFQQPWFILYVLLVPRQGNHEPGRYQSGPFETHSDFADFLQKFRDFFEDDGRHHIWVGTTTGNGLLVYDQHNVIFGYGPLDRFKRILAARGFRESDFWFPSPHSHAFQPKYDVDEERLMSAIEWKYFPLQPGDEWD